MSKAPTTIEELKRRLSSLSSLLRDVDLRCSDAWRTTTQELEDVFVVLKRTDSSHIDQALESDGFRFERSQVELEECYRTFGRLARRVHHAAREGAPGSAELNRISDLAIIGERAPMATRATLANIRQARRERLTRLTHS